MEEMCFRVLITGLSYSGKTSIYNRLLKLTDSPLAAGRNTECIVKDDDNRRFRMQVFHAPFYAVVPGIALLKNTCSVLMMVFDITETNSFGFSIVKYSQTRHLYEDIPVILVGNKCDCVAEREVSIDRIRLVCDEMNMLYIEVSAKENINIELLTQKIVEMAKERSVLAYS